MSLRTRLLILVIAAMLVPAILVGLRFVQNRASEIDAALANLVASADDIASDLDEKIQGTAHFIMGSPVPATSTRATRRRARRFCLTSAKNILSSRAS